MNSLKKLLAGSALAASLLGAVSLVQAADQTSCQGGVYKLCIRDYENANGTPGTYKNIQSTNKNWSSFGWANQADWYRNYHASQKACVHKYAWSSSTGWDPPAHSIGPGDTLAGRARYNLGNGNRWTGGACQ
ncbi:MAG: hypothetical protein ABW352_13730 [Polyangiales bacterium]